MTAATLRIITTALARGWLIDRTTTGRLRLRDANGAAIVFGVSEP